MFPVSGAELLTVTGLGALVAIVVQFAKQYTDEKRILNVVALVLAQVVAIMATLVTTSWAPSGEQWLSAVSTGLFAAGVATWGNEAIKNLLGLAGYGSRSDAGRFEEAMDVVARDRQAR